ncbi:hypothetical protein A0U40_07100 [[Bacillus] sp. KCTC 13219]|nr:hypothetical protein A0U40_07100 [[Bacillus] sp. KCTC 13219]
MRNFMRYASLSAVLVFSAHTFVNAEDADIKERNIISFDAQENIGVSDQPPILVLTDKVTTYGTDRPLSKWDLSTNGKYNFSGGASNSTLYTDYYFTGKNQVTLVIKNNSFSNFLDVGLAEVSLLGGTVWGAQIGLGKTLTITIPVDSSKKYYLAFGAPSNFTGSIQ